MILNVQNLNVASIGLICFQCQPYYDIGNTGYMKQYNFSANQMAYYIKIGVLYQNEIILKYIDM